MAIPQGAGVSFKNVLLFIVYLPYQSLRFPYHDNDPSLRQVAHPRPRPNVIQQNIHILQHQAIDLYGTFFFKMM
jgi:hypothetical protein